MPSLCLTKDGEMKGNGNPLWGVMVAFLLPFSRSSLRQELGRSEKGEPENVGRHRFVTNKVFGVLKGSWDECGAPLSRTNVLAGEDESKKVISLLSFVGSLVLSLRDL